MSATALCATDQSYGATDEFGFAAMENKMHVHDLIAERRGLDWLAHWPNTVAVHE